MKSFHLLKRFQNNRAKTQSFMAETHKAQLSKSSQTSSCLINDNFMDSLQPIVSVQKYNSKEHKFVVKPLETFRLRTSAQ